MNATVVGLGKLGLPLAVLLARSGYNVVGFDKNFELVERLQKGTYKSQEVKLLEYLQSTKIHFTSKITELSGNCEIYFYIVPTPSLPNGSFSNEFLLSAIQDTAGDIRESCKRGKVVLDIVSTVMPGSCAGEISEFIEKETGLEVGEDLGICYNPEFIALGSVIHDMENPDMHLIGSSDGFSGAVVEAALRKISKRVVPVAHMNLFEAELVKISINNFVTMKISFANGLMQIAEKLGSIDINKVTAAIGLDSRIGPKYLLGAMPYGGPCFPRDTRALDSLFKHLGIKNELANQVEVVNIEHAKFIGKKVANEATKFDSKVGIFGLSYKMGTNVIDDSPSLEVAKYLVSRNIETFIWDDENAQIPDEISGIVQNMDSLESLLKSVKVLLIARDSRFSARLKELLKTYSGTVFDPWRILEE